MIDRRSFLSVSVFGASGMAFSFCGFSKRVEKLEEKADFSHLRALGYGQLAPAATKNTGEILLALPPGFEYNVIGKSGSIMSDTRATPAAHDGMAAFKVRNELRLIRNHEINNGSKPKIGSAIGPNPYDESAGGGTTTLIIDNNTRLVRKDFASLSGTLVNCAGGPTPWGSWISCEETTLGPTIREGGEGGFLKPHGYCFEVFASADAPQTPQPLKAMGRFAHEAAAVDKKSGVLYLTEDRTPSGFYRFLPKRNKRLAEGGELQMLAIKDKPNYETGKAQKPGLALETTWVKIDDPDPPEADVDDGAVYKQGAQKGAAAFMRLEGCFPAEGGGAYFVSTSGGDNGGGQIWRYEPDGKESGRLTLVFESPSRTILDMPDNICPRPGSPNLFICEDSDYAEAGGTRDNFIRILAPSGKIADFAQNIVPDFSTTEFAGATFSPDGKTLFVSVQVAGMTFAIWGDWERFQN